MNQAQVSENYGKTGTEAVKKRALLVIDVQNEYFSGKLPITYPADTLPNVIKAATFAKEHGIAVIIVQHTMLESHLPVFKKGTHEWELHENIAKIVPDFYIEKHKPSSFVGTNLEEILRQENIDTVAISGYMTHICCDTTARYAFHLGFNVEFLSDATATLALKNSGGEVSAEELHRVILAVQQSRFSTVMSTTQWMKEIDHATY